MGHLYRLKEKQDFSTSPLLGCKESTTDSKTCFLLFQGPNSNVTYAITADEKAREFFSIDSARGTIALKKSLVGELASRYAVSTLITLKSLNYFFLLSNIFE